MATIYRSDVDGLRAIAVLLVVFYHAGFDLLSGGFIGVDIFFVISGFLITGIIYTEMRERRFSFSNFYLRRIKRILPVFYTVALVTLISGYFLLLPDDYTGLSAGLQSALYFSSNLYFWKSSAGYFTFNAEEMPFLHTWSLSVEEQFYLLWPLMLLLIIAFRRSRYFFLFLVALAVFSFSLAQWEAVNKPRAAYYLLHYRAGELLLGAIVALWLAKKQELPAPLSHFLGILGIVAILFSAFWFDRTTVFPGFSALLPCVGAALVILSGADRASSSSKLLSLPPLVGVGLISYSLYLWHWPILAFVRYLQYEVTPALGLIVIAISLLLSFLSWRLVEQPARRMKITFTKAFSLLFLLPAISFFALSEAIVRNDGLIARFDDRKRDLYQQHIETDKFAEQATGWCHVNADEQGNFYQKFDSSMLECSVGERMDSGRIRGLLWGDSHAAHFAPFLDVVGKERGIEVDVITTAGCPSILNAEKKLGENPDVCKNFRGFIKEHVEDFDVVYIASRWDLVGDATADFGDFAESLNYVSSRVDHVVVFSQIPLFRNERSTSYKLRKALIPWMSEKELEKVYDTNEKYVVANRIVKDLMGDLSNVVLLDFKPFFCDNVGCSQEIDGVHAYYDRSHLNIQGAQRLAMSFLRSKQQMLDNGDHDLAFAEAGGRKQSESFSDPINDERWAKQPAQLSCGMYAEHSDRSESSRCANSGDDASPRR